MRTLAEFVARRRPTPDEINSLASTLASILDDSHAAHHIFDNLSPDTLHVSSPNGYLVLSPSPPHPPLPADSPFRAPHLPPSIDSDRYSFAAVLYWLFHGQPPPYPLPRPLPKSIPAPWDMCIAAMLQGKLELNALNLRISGFRYCESFVQYASTPPPPFFKLLLVAAILIAVLLLLTLYTQRTSLSGQVLPAGPNLAVILTPIAPPILRPHHRPSRFQ